MPMPNDGHGQPPEKAYSDDYARGLSEPLSMVQFQALISGKFHGVPFTIMYRKNPEDQKLWPVSAMCSIPLPGPPPPPGMMMWPPWSTPNTVQPLLQNRAFEEARIKRIEADVLDFLGAIMLLSHENAVEYIRTKTNLVLDEDKWKEKGLEFYQVPESPDSLPQLTDQNIKTMFKEGTSTYGHKKPPLK